MEGIGLHIAMLLSWALAGVAGGAAGIGTGMTALPLVLLFQPFAYVVCNNTGQSRQNKRMQKQTSIAI
jgi:uncharacterized membrane protein YfcA